VVADVWDTATGEVYRRQQRADRALLSKLIEAGVEEFEVFFPERDEVGTVISATIKKDPVKAQNEALIEIYRKLRPGDPPTLDTATQLFQGMFFDPRKYDFSRVGRMKFNIKLHEKADATVADLDKRTLDGPTTSATPSSTC
jgi:DNA-directed RNA polymerase subunit beta